MQVKNKIINCKTETSIALGCFDGVHKGHVSVIKAATNSKYKSCVFTFRSDPQNFFSSVKTPQIYSNDQKNIIFKNLGIDFVFYIPFEEIREINSSDFIKKILIEKLNAKQISCGFNYHFGKGGSSTATDLKQICKKNDIDIEIVSPVYHDGSVISSTRIRNLITSGNLKIASELLGRPFSIISKPKKILKNAIIQYVNKNMYIVPKEGLYKSKIIFNKNYIVPSETQITFNTNDAILKTYTYHDMKNFFSENLEIVFIQ